MDLPVASFAPDQAPLTAVSGMALNVLPKTKLSRGPCKALVAATNALTNRCQGAGSFRGKDGTIATFGGDDTKLYLKTDATFSDVSRLAGGAYGTPENRFWRFGKYGSYVIAVNGFDAPQYWQIGVSTNWAALSALGDTPPEGAMDIAVCREYVFMAQSLSDNTALQWSASDDITGWTAGIGLSGIQTFPDGGQIVGLRGGRTILVFLENKIFEGTFVGPDDVFQFDEISIERGCAAQGSIAAYQNLTFFLAYDGFFMIGPNGITPIGDGIIDNTFWGRNPDISGISIDNLHRVTAVCDPVLKHYRVSFPSTSSGSGSCDTQFIYSWADQEWTMAQYNLDYLFRARTGEGLTLEDLDALYPGGLETIPYSLDSYRFAGNPQESLAAFGTDKKMGYFDGANLAATIDSIEGEIVPGRKARIRSVRPIVDGGAPTVRVGIRDDKLNDTPRLTNAIAQRDTGRCPFATQRTRGRYHRARFEMPAGQVWNDFQGFDVSVLEAGNR